MTPVAPDAEPGPSAERGHADSARAASRPDRMRLLAALVCALQSLTLVLLCGFYLWELAQGASDDAGRAVVSAVLIALVAVALGVLARAWQRGAAWPNTPTVVWNALLLPVAWSLFQSDRTLLGAAVGLVAVAAIVASIGARTAAGTGDTDPAHPDPSQGR